MILNDQQLPQQEGPTVEFKVQWSDTVKSTLCSFLNTRGGKIYFGISDDGQVVGIDYVDKVQRAIVSVMRFSMHPDASPLCKTYTETIDNKTIVVAEVLEAKRPPYYVTENRLNSKKRTCYMRHGSSDYEVTEDELHALHQKAILVPYELRPSSEQELTFNTLGQYFQNANIIFDASKFYTLGIINRAGFFTNLASWVSDQCEIRTNVGIFTGTDKASPSGGITSFTGCIIDQYSKIQNFLNNRFGFAYQIAAFNIRRDGTRNEIREYPEAAIREALVNLFVHRDYSIPAASSITCFADRLEFMSYGGLVKDVDIELIKIGASVPRNQKLADMMLRLSAMEQYGIGIPLMFSSYKQFGIEPRLEELHRALLITLPKITANYDALNQTEQAAVSFLRQRGEIKRAELENNLNLSYGSTVQLIKTLTYKNVIEKVGNGPRTRYRLK